MLLRPAVQHQMSYFLYAFDTRIVPGRCVGSRCGVLVGLLSQPLSFSVLYHQLLRKTAAVRFPVVLLYVERSTWDSPSTEDVGYILHDWWAVNFPITEQYIRRLFFTQVQKALMHCYQRGPVTRRFSLVD